MFQTLISPMELSASIDHKNWIICDCRFDIHNPELGHRSYLEGHLPSAIYVDLNKDMSIPPEGTNGRHPLPDEDKLIGLVEALGISNHAQVVVYDDDGGGIAARLWWILKYLGHDTVALLDGGIQAWISSGFSITRVVNPPRKAQFRANLQKDRLVTVEQLQALLSQGSHLLLDSRAPERYRGDEEPLDPVGGHIPGAHNRYWRENLGSSDAFKPAPALRKELRLFVGDSEVEDAIVYCGSGVTACHNILAFVHAGYPMPRLYVGSWSEWSSDPGRAVVAKDG